MDGGVVIERARGHAARRAALAAAGQCACSTRWIGSWNDEATALCATPTTATCMCAVRKRASGCWHCSSAATTKLHLKINESKTRGGQCVWPQISGLLPMDGPERRGQARGGEARRWRRSSSGSRQLTRRSGGRSMSEVIGTACGRIVPGWKAYFGTGADARVLRELDEWMRHRLRAIQLKHWRRGTTIYRELRALGREPGQAAQLVAGNSRRWWRNSRLALNNVLTIAYFDRLGVPRLYMTSTSRTARCGPACRVVWEGSGQLPDRPYPDSYSSQIELGRVFWQSHEIPVRCHSPRPALLTRSVLASDHGAGGTWAFGEGRRNTCAATVCAVGSS